MIRCPLFPLHAALLAPSGLLIVAHLERRNLDRHGKPEADVLIGDGGLRGLLPVSKSFPTTKLGATTIATNREIRSPNRARQSTIPVRRLCLSSRSAAQRQVGGILTITCNPMEGIDRTFLQMFDLAGESSNGPRSYHESRSGSTPD